MTVPKVLARHLQPWLKVCLIRLQHSYLPKIWQKLIVLQLHRWQRVWCTLLLLLPVQSVLSKSSVPSSKRRKLLTEDSTKSPPSMKSPPERSIPNIVRTNDKEVSHDDVILIIDSPSNAAAYNEVTEEEQFLEVPEEERFCSKCSATPCEWLNWKDVMEPYIREIEEIDLAPNEKRFSCYLSTGTLLPNATDKVLLVNEIVSKFHSALKKKSMIGSLTLMGSLVLALWKRQVTTITITFRFLLHFDVTLQLTMLFL